MQADWDAFGQRQTDSGNVAFRQLLLSHDEVLQAPGVVPTRDAIAIEDPKNPYANCSRCAPRTRTSQLVKAFQSPEVQQRVEPLCPCRPRG